MRLKRGIERASCDFCHRRKIKCDRASREAQGKASCSPCSLRQIQCSLDDSDDIRLRRRRKTNVDDEVHAEQSTLQPPTTTTRSPAAAAAAADAAGTNVEGVNNLRVNLITSATEIAPIPLEEHEQLLPSYFPSNINYEIPSSVDQTPDFSFVDTPFELSPESILFLDQIFMGGYDAPLDYLEPQILLDDDVQASGGGEHGIHTGHGQPNKEPSAGSAPPQPWLDCGLDEAAFDEALHAYFKFAAIHLPVLIEDAFWQDYRSGRCSLALVYAIACRGMPFTAALNTWDKQQTLAIKFREKFLEAQQTSTGRTVMRLDDLEALALMVDWTYDETQSSPLQSQLGSLFLTHESLVLATLQSQMQDGNVDTLGPSAPLARLEERRQLLFWRVYGIDAFHSLDQKTISRIPDGENHDSASRKLPLHDTGSYLDAILNLAIIAREILQVLVTVKTKRKGVRSQDVMDIYEKLNRWQKHDCPLRLRRRRDVEGKLMPPTINESSSKPQFLHPLHCLVLWLLEINLYLQLEDCVSQYGVQSEAPFEAEMTILRVESEALRAVHDAVEISHWMKQYSAAANRVSTARDHSLVDLAPSITRDIYAGLCFWTSGRGKKVFRQEFPSIMNNMHAKGRQRADQRKEEVNSYMKVAKEFRNIVATATSHKDTKYVLERLDGQIASLEDLLTH